MSLASQTLSSEQDRARWGTKVLDDAILFIKQYIGLDQMSRQEVLECLMMQLLLLLDNALVKCRCTWGKRVDFLVSDDWQWGSISTDPKN